MSLHHREALHPIKMLGFFSVLPKGAHQDDNWRHVFLPAAKPFVPAFQETVADSTANSSGADTYGALDCPPPPRGAWPGPG